jgi:ABC-2 type transport system permease protein
MRWHEFSVVFRREFFTRIHSKAFWISTLLTPLFMFAITVLPSLFASKQREAVVLGVQDPAGIYLDPLHRALEERRLERPDVPISIVALPAGLPADSLDARVEAKVIDAYLLLPAEAVDADEINYHARVTTNFNVQRQIELLLSRVIVAQRLRERGLDVEAIQGLSKPVSLNPVSVSEGNMGGEAQFYLAFALFMLLYMMLVFHGQAILRSVLEEKSSRIIEVMVSSLRPAELLLGKITGVGAAGFLQLSLWLLTGLALSGAASIGLLAAGRMPTIQPALVVHTLLFFVIGFLIYAALFAIVGAMHNNETEAQQFAGLVLAPIIVPAILMPGIITAPSSTPNVILSLVPFMAPLTMIMRLSVSSVPAWQVGLAYVLAIALIVVELWIAARIYRVGILMYGKRPTARELAKWARYSA